MDSFPFCSIFTNEKFRFAINYFFCNFQSSFCWDCISSSLSELWPFLNPTDSSIPLSITTEEHLSTHFYWSRRLCCSRSKAYVISTCTVLSKCKVRTHAGVFTPKGCFSLHELTKKWHFFHSLLLDLHLQMYIIGQNCPKKFLPFLKIKWDWGEIWVDLSPVPSCRSPAHRLTD